MLTVRPANERGHANHGWLNSFHSFSFASYHDPRHMGVGPLRVINEDRVAPGQGFGMHSHRDMEILSVVLDGELAHKDNIGNGAVIRPGEIQRMTAGTGIAHSEFNPSESAAVHFLQIWIEPSQVGLTPGYEQRAIDPAWRRGKLVQLAGPNEDGPGVLIHQDASLYGGDFDGDETASHELDASRRAYVFVASGRATINGERLGAGDAALIERESVVDIGQGQSAHVLLFDLP